ncbi:MAG: transglutaminase domain-containing protein [Christensenellales bacterium]|jgi:hypothetical protein|nr:hypothetical protein [Clostridiales bacterium]
MMKKVMKKSLIVYLSLLVAVALLMPSITLAGSIKETPYAYIKPSTHYFLIGQEVIFDVVMPVTEGYTYEFNMYHSPDRTQNENFKGVDQVKKSTVPTYSFTPKELGQYFLEVWVYDKDYGSLKLQSETFYSYQPEDEQDPNTLPGKVKAIGAELAALNLPTQYEKALWLHDWLTHNADYDEPMTIHTPEGVLLRGKGVCESYALAYQMLLAEADMEGIYVTGYSRGESHAWNLVNIDGEWTYVDVTWGDPKGGGAECHDYFGLNDTLLSRDHDWSYSNCRPPKAETLKYNYLLLNGAVPFQDEEEMVQVISLALENKEPVILYTYHGSDRYFDVSYTLQRWMKKNYSRFFVDSYQFGGSKFSGTLNVVYGDFDDYIKFVSEEDFTNQMQEILTAKPAQLKAYYIGEDDYFDFGIFINRWLRNNSAAFGVTSYSYTYYPVHGIVEIQY